MSAELTPARRSRGGRALALAAPAVILALVAATLSACSGSSSGASHNAQPQAAAPSLPTPLATSLQTAGGIWATLPMGRLNEPLNTFWQLFHRASAGGAWANRVEATAVATNGGLVLASPGGRGVLVGVRPSNLLTFSPLIASSDEGRTWSTGLLGGGLAARPDSLAAGAAGQTLGLVGTRGGVQILASGAGLSVSRALTSERALAASAAGRTCGVGSLTAVAYLGAQPLVGASCARAGVVGIFLARGGAWQLLEGPPLGALAGGRVEVISLQASGGGVRALLGLERPSGELALLAASYRAGRWRVTPPLALGASEQLSSSGSAGAGGSFVLLSGGAAGARVLVSSAPGAGWRELATPPAGTATLAFGPGARVEALAVAGTTLEVWALAPNARAWTRRQDVNVPIEFGSSE